VDAPRNECAENFELSIPDKNKTYFSHLAKIQEVTCFKRLERNKQSIRLSSVMSSINILIESMKNTKFFFFIKFV